MTLLQAWYDMAMDGKLWYDLYRGHWPLGIKLEAQLDHTRKTLKVGNIATTKFPNLLVKLPE